MSGDDTRMMVVSFSVKMLGGKPIDATCRGCGDHWLSVDGVKSYEQFIAEHTEHTPR